MDGFTYWAKHIITVSWKSSTRKFIHSSTKILWEHVTHVKKFNTMRVKLVKWHTTQVQHKTHVMMRVTNTNHSHVTPTYLPFIGSLLFLLFYVYFILLCFIFSLLFCTFIKLHNICSKIADVWHDDDLHKVTWVWLWLTYTMSCKSPTRVCWCASEPYGRTPMSHINRSLRCIISFF